GWGGVRSWSLRPARTTPSQPPPASRGRSRKRPATAIPPSHHAGDSHESGNETMTTIHAPHALRQGLNTLAIAIAVALLGAPAASQAQAVPDAQAGLHRPGMDTAANGTPVVNIVAPSAGGVSHNQFQS